MRKILSALLIGSAVMLSACGGGSQASKQINVTLTDFQFTPNTFTVPAGQPITLNATNNGSVVHNFVILKSGASAGGSWSSDDEANVYWRIQLEPGSSKTDTFTAPQDPGDYQVVCSTPGHIEAGMIAKLVVVAAQ